MPRKDPVAKRQYESEYRKKNRQKLRDRQNQCRKNNRERFSNYQKKHRRKKLYGISDDQYQMLLNRSRGICEICGKKKRLVIDHDHRTGLVRGLICQHCNVGLGFLDNKQFMDMATVYLNK